MVKTIFFINIVVALRLMIIKCSNCKHKGESKSKLGFVIFASCGKRIKRKKVKNARTN
jgi:hypothetical protein